VLLAGVLGSCARHPTAAPSRVVGDVNLIGAARLYGLPPHPHSSDPVPARRRRRGRRSRRERQPGQSLRGYIRIPVALSRPDSPTREVFHVAGVQEPGRHEHTPVQQAGLAYSDIDRQGFTQVVSGMCVNSPLTVEPITASYYWRWCWTAPAPPVA
jgi:hypothetical protein